MTENSEKKGWQNVAEDKFKPSINEIEIFRKIIDAFPHSITLNTPDGTLVYANKTGLKLYQINPDRAIGKYSIFQDSTIDAAMPFEKIKRVLKGETVFFPAVKAPLPALSVRDSVEYDMDALYLDITYFPIIVDGRVAYFVQHQVPCRVYRGKKEIEQAKEYIDNNWLEKFCLDKVLAASGLSKSHFTRLFRQHTGITAHEYYIRVKIERLKEKLSDPHSTVSQAFAACNLDYSGHFARVFKDRVGVSPSEYRRSINHT